MTQWEAVHKPNRRRRLCPFHSSWPRLLVWYFCYCLMVLHLVSLQLHRLRKNRFYLVALSILEGPSTPEGRSWVLFSFVLFLNATNNRRNDIVCIGCTCFPEPGWGVLFFLLNPHSPFILATHTLLFGGNFSGSWFLRELPIPGNSEILPRGPQRLLFYCPHPPSTCTI